MPVTLNDGIIVPENPIEPVALNPQGGGIAAPALIGLGALRRRVYSGSSSVSQ